MSFHGRSTGRIIIDVMLLRLGCLLWLLLVLLLLLLLLSNEGAAAAAALVVLAARYLARGNRLWRLRSLGKPSSYRCRVLTGASSSSVILRILELLEQFEE